MFVYMSCDAAKLSAEMNKHARTATVEAEYGDILVMGNIATLAHHGKRSGMPCPCLRENIRLELDAIGISHLDLDCLGGILSLLGVKPDKDSFWSLAAWVDNNGPHRAKESPDATDENMKMLWAWWAWKEEHELYPPRDGEVVEISDELAPYRRAIEGIFEGRKDMLEAGDVFRRKEEVLNNSSYLVDLYHSVIIREHDNFVNHLYITPDGKVCDAVVSLKKKTGEITVSLAQPHPEIDCGDFMQKEFGPEAGGKDVIAGSPRSGGFDIRRALRVATSLAKALKGED